ncbi:MAG: thioredoxin domain-containing protein [Chitinophagales bacterium]
MNTNSLIHESSPYLLQHAHNPVDWHPWGIEVLQKAQKEDKPILVSIGYAACHWCHVMERESFESEEVAAYMNEHFVNIKVDREERPDVDQIYMDAVQMLSGSGGWPLNCFLTPDGRPFYGGTYYPPKPMYNRPSWLQILEQISNVFKTRRKDVEEQANQLTYHIATSDQNTSQNTLIGLDFEQPFEAEQLEGIFQKMTKYFDADDGGFGGAPKFPGSMGLEFLLNYYHYTQTESALNHALFSIDKMIFGGIYDQIGGGFARYTVDKKWLVPHFEKMLYDNALLVGLISDAYKLTKKDLYREAIEDSLAFVEREMLHPDGGFYASYDADSEGVEGKFYVWDKSEIDVILKDDAAIFNRFYEVTEGGNWEHKNILNRETTYQDFAAQEKMSVEALKERLQRARRLLFEVREKRVKPGLDDKIILSWNAMMVTAFAKAYQALQQGHYKEIAVNNLQFLLDKFAVGDSGELKHTYKNGKAQFPAFLDDYALLIEAIIEVFQISFDERLLEWAAKLTNYVFANFEDSKGFLFYYTPKGQQDIVLRKKEFYDNATPSGNSTMAHNLLKLAVLLDEPKYHERAVQMVKSMEESISKYPTSFARWLNVMTYLVFPLQELAVVGENAAVLTAELQQLFVPNKLLMMDEKGEGQHPLLANRYVEGKTLIYRCQNFVCERPVETVKELK